MKKLEIIVSTIYSYRIFEILDNSKAEGYTGIDISEGKGKDGGRIQDMGLVPAQNEVYIFSVTDDKVAKSLIKEFKTLSETIEFKLFCSEIEELI